MKRILGLMVGLVLLTGCTGTQAARTEVVTVEGTVNVRGNEPFTAVILQTQGDNYYALDLSGEQRSMFRTPGRIQVTGSLYRGDFAGRPFARIRVSEIVVR